MKLFFSAHILLLASGSLHAAQQTQSLKRRAPTQQVINHDLDERLIQATKASDLDEIKALFNSRNHEIPDINAREPVPAHVRIERRMDGMTPLMIATDLGNEEMVDFLIKQGADLNLQTNGGLTALYMATLFGEDKYTRDEYPTLADDEDYFDGEPNLEIAKMLLDAGANVNATTPFPLLREALYHATHIVDYIMDDEELADRYTKEYIDLAKDIIRHGAPIEGDELGFLYNRYFDEELVEMLMNAGADLNDQGLGGDTVLFDAIRSSNAAFIKKMLQKGANPYIRNMEGRNAFDILKIAKQAEIDDMPNFEFDSPEHEKEYREEIEQRFAAIAQLLQEFEKTQTPEHRRALQSAVQRVVESKTGELGGQDVAEEIMGYLKERELPDVKAEIEREEQEKEDKNLNLAPMSDE